jgi:hypothetical protein
LSDALDRVGSGFAVRPDSDAAAGIGGERDVAPLPERQALVVEVVMRALVLDEKPLAPNARART